MSDDKIITLDQVIYGTLYYLLEYGYTPIVDDELLLTIIGDLEKDCLVDDQESNLSPKIVEIHSDHYELKSYRLKKLFQIKCHLLQTKKYLKQHSDALVLNYLEQNQEIINQKARKL